MRGFLIFLCATFSAIACAATNDAHSNPNDLQIVYRENIDLQILSDAENHSVVIRAVYKLSRPLVQLLVCIPRPNGSRTHVEATFNFSFYDGERILLSKLVPSVVREKNFESFFIEVEKDFMQSLRLNMIYLDSERERFQPRSDFSKYYRINFDGIAEELIQKELAKSYNKNLLEFPPEPTCVQ